MGDVVFNAAVDWTVEVSAISGRVFNSMKLQTPKLLTADRKMSKQGSVMDLVNLKIGNC